jgi:thiazole synthase ThiGH ThiG subunit
MALPPNPHPRHTGQHRQPKRPPPNGVTTMKMRCQIKMIRYRQVDIEVEPNASGKQIEEAIKERATREFGDCDKIKVAMIETVKPLLPTS